MGRGMTLGTLTTNQMSIILIYFSKLLQLLMN